MGQVASGVNAYLKGANCRLRDEATVRGFGFDKSSSVLGCQSFFMHATMCSFLSADSVILKATRSSQLCVTASESCNEPQDKDEKPEEVSMESLSSRSGFQFLPCRFCDCAALSLLCWVSQKSHRPAISSKPQEGQPGTQTHTHTHTQRPWLPSLVTFNVCGTFLGRMPFCAFAARVAASLHIGFLLTV